MLRIQTSYDPEFFGWVFADDEKGQRVLKSMVDFNTDREDISVNVYEVVLFRSSSLARELLKIERVKPC